MFVWNVDLDTGKTDEEENAIVERIQVIAASMAEVFEWATRMASNNTQYLSVAGIKRASDDLELI